MLRNSELSNWQMRVVEERAVLQEKLVKLDAFMRSPMFEVLPHADKSLLHQQRTIMQAYVEVLFQRISRFRKEGVL